MYSSRYWYLFSKLNPFQSKFLCKNVHQRLSPRHNSVVSLAPYILKFSVCSCDLVNYCFHSGCFPACVKSQVLHCTSLRYLCVAHLSCAFLVFDLPCLGSFLYCCVVCAMHVSFLEDLAVSRHKDAWLIFGRFFRQCSTFIWLLLCRARPLTTFWLHFCQFLSCVSHLLLTLMVSKAARYF